MAAHLCNPSEKGMETGEPTGSSGTSQRGVSKESETLKETMPKNSQTEDRRTEPTLQKLYFDLYASHGLSAHVCTHTKSKEVF